MIRYALTIFLSAFLLFQVQPLIGKFILPWFGGTPAVWTTCMLFFQVLLLAGYSYAHLISSRLRGDWQGLVHIVLLIVSLVFLPIVPHPDFKPGGSEWPPGRIMMLLGITIGVPYLLLSATGPLLQEWFRRTNPGRSPYRLYALSNVGSLLALVTYPFLFEPNLQLGTQAASWSAAYTVFVLFCGWCAGKLIWDNRPSAIAASNDPMAAPLPPQQPPKSVPVQPSVETAPPVRPSWADVVTWVGLAATGSALLLSTTNQMCQEVAVVPFLWVLPLALYLLTFIICFDSPFWYVRPVFALGFGVSVMLAIWMLALGMVANIWGQIASFSTALFMGCMLCHGEIYRSRPHPKYLTLFYLTVSAGGALGGFFVAIIAPQIFASYWEYHWSLVATVLFVFVAWFRDRNWYLYRGRPVRAWLLLASCLIMLCGSLIFQAAAQVGRGRVARNFFAALRIEDRDVDKPEQRRTLFHGRTMHGFQYASEERRMWPTSYYGRTSGVGLAIEQHPRRKAGEGLRIGVIGLGTGTIAALAEEQDYLRFYEINPMVIEFSAGDHPLFTYLHQSKAKDVHVVQGDARIQLERELAVEGSQKFDVLAVDAFSSDSIPMHLLTLECAQLYQQHLKPDGILALHISNRHLDLEPVAQALAEQLNMQAVQVNAKGQSSIGVDSSDWVLLTSNMEFLDSEPIQTRGEFWTEETQPSVLWTDDYGSLWQVLRKPELDWNPFSE